MVEIGSLLCCFYALNDPEIVASRIKREENLPSFTDITNKDKSYINKARFNLYSLLMPISERETAVRDFVDVTKYWLKREMYIPKESLESFASRYILLKSAKEFIKEYTKESFFYHILNQALRRLTNPLDSFYIRQPFQDLFLAVLELY